MSAGGGPGPCEAVQDDLAELALGILPGRERSEVLAHLDGCQRCTSALSELSTVVDTLVQLAGGAEPSLGFEQRLTQRLQVATPAEPAPGRLRRLRFPALAAAALVLLAVALGFGIGSLTSSTGGTGSSGPPRAAVAEVASAQLRSGGEVLGEVFVAAGAPSWMFMTIDTGGWRSAVTCQVTLAGGRVVTIGRFRLTDGYGAWAAPLAVPAGEVRSARLLGAGGAVVASARLS
jgi:hypothetical protein